MSTAFDDLTSLDAASLISLTGEFAESVTYVPRAGSERSIYAAVIRNPPATPQELSRGVAPSLIISVRNSVTSGIVITELDTGGDAVKLKLRLGDAASTTILLPPPDSQDAGMITFRIGKR